MTADASAAQTEPVALRVRVRPWMAVAVLIATLAMAVVGYGLAKSLPASQSPVSIFSCFRTNGFR